MDRETTEQQDTTTTTEDLQVTDEEAEAIAGGKRKTSTDPDAGAQRA